MQINEEELKEKMGDLDISSDYLDEIMLLVKQSVDELDPDDESAASTFNASDEQALLMRLDEETDWRKKAALAARIISMKL